MYPIWAMNHQIYHRAVAVQQHPPHMPGKNPPVTSGGTELGFCR